jgi:Uncharacterized protein family UPF0029
MSKRGLPEDTNSAPTTPKRARQTLLSSNLTPTIPTLPPNATKSTPIEDRKSKFIGYFVPLSTTSLVSRTKALIESLPELVDADHKIMAWNVGQSTGFDDDGEKWGGRKVLEILTTSDDEGVLCVARWYGGIMLGPVRFDHIIHVAADALATYHISMKKNPIITSPTITSPRTLNDGERERLIRVLKGKDMTVENVRGMITAKKVEKGLESPLASPVKEKNYERMQVDGLKRLVIARDAAIKSLRDILKELNQSSTESASVESRHHEGD